MPRLHTLVSIPMLALLSCDRAPASAPSKSDVSPVPIELARLVEPPTKPPDGDWLTFESDEGHFAAKFPRAPTRTLTPVPTAIGDLEMLTHGVQFDGAYYAISTWVYSADLVAESDLQVLLDGGRDGAVANIDGELISERPLTIAGAPGRRLLIRTSDSGVEVETMHCVFGSRGYQAVVVHEPGSPAQVELFFSGFEPRPESQSHSSGDAGAALAQ